MATETKDKPVSPEVTALAAKLRKNITIDPATGQATLTVEDYKANLPEGVTEDTVKAVDAYNGLYLHAAALAHGEESVPVLKKHKELEATHLTANLLGRNKIEIGFKRSTETSRPGAPADEPKTVNYGVVSAKFDFASSRPRGEMARVKSHLADLAAGLAPKK
jgi:hypothetical protein